MTARAVLAAAPGVRTTVTGGSLRPATASDAAAIHGLIARYQNEGRLLPRPEAETLVRVSSPPVRTCYEQFIQVVGPRDAVLDYAAHLMHEDRRTTEHPRPLLEVESLDIGEDATFTLVLSRMMFDG